MQINGTNLPGTIYTSAQNPFAQNGGNLPAATPFGSSNVNYMVDPLWKNPYSEQHNLGIEEQFGDRTVLSLTMWQLAVERDLLCTFRATPEHHSGRGYCQ